MHCLWFLDLLVPVAPVLLLTTLSITNTMVASLSPATLLCPGDYPLALLGHCCSVLSPPRTTEPPAAVNTDLWGRLGSAAPELQNRPGSSCFLHSPHGMQPAWTGMEEQLPDRATEGSGREQHSGSHQG